MVDGATDDEMQEALSTGGVTVLGFSQVYGGLEEAVMRATADEVG